MASPWLRSLSLLLLVIPLTSCGWRLGGVPPREPGQPTSTPARTSNKRPFQSQAQRQRIQQERCLRERPGLEAQMAALRRAELQLARVKEETYTPLPPPQAWDELKESRYRLEDRETDWQTHLEAQKAWKRQEELRRARWQAEHQDRLNMAQWRLDRQAQQLRSQRPDLFTGPRSIEFNPAVADDIGSCRAAAVT